MMLDLIVETTAEPVTKRTVLNITTSDNLNFEKLHLFSLLLADDRHTAMVEGEYKSKSISSSCLAYNKKENAVQGTVDPEIGDSAKHRPVDNDSRTLEEIEDGRFVDSSLLERVQHGRVCP